MDEKGGSRVDEFPDWFWEVPCLICMHGNSRRKQVQSFYSPFNSKAAACVRSIPQLRGKMIVMIKHGWLLLRDHTQLTNLCLFNPLASQSQSQSQSQSIIRLPPLLQDWLGDGDEDEDEYWITAGELTSPPDRDDSMLLLCLNRTGLLAFCRPARSNCTWVAQPIELQGVEKEVSIERLVALNGLLYGSTFSDVLFCAAEEGSDNHNHHTLTLKPLQTVVEPDDKDIDATYLRRSCVESCGLYYLVVTYMLQPIIVEEGRHRQMVALKVYELNLDSYNWVEVKSLNGRAFFISDGATSWCWGDSFRGIAGDCIYLSFPAHLETLYMYNLLDQTFITLSPCPTLVTPCSYPLWIIPQLRQQQTSLSASEERKESIQKTGFANQKVSQTHDDVVEDENGILSKLPLDLIELVAIHLHLFEYWSLRVTCKTLISGLPEPYQRRSIDSCPPFPLFMVLKQDDRLCTIIDPCRHDSRSNNSVFPSHSNRPLTLQYSKGGWVCYSVGKKLLEYINVLTRVVHGRLPSLPAINFDNHDNDPKSIAFSTYPTCSQCISVAIYGDDEEVAFSYIRPGDGAWNTSSFRHEYHPFHPTHSTPVFLNGAFYYMDMHGYLGEFRLMDDEPTWHVYYNKPQFIQGDVSYLSSLVECNGQLYSIFVGHMGDWIQVFWFDCSDECWVEIDHLENFSFFISRKSSLSIATSDDRMRNKIFLPWISRDKTIVCYSLSSKKYHIWGLDDDARDNLIGFGEPHWSCWFSYK